MLFLEEYVIPWLKKWHIGFGMMGEQGAECIHKYFNTLGSRYNTVPTDSVDRLKLMLKEHLLHISPSTTSSTTHLPSEKKEAKGVATRLKTPCHVLVHLNYVHCYIQRFTKTDTALDFQGE